MLSLKQIFRKIQSRARILIENEEYGLEWKGIARRKDHKDRGLGGRERREWIDELKYRQLNKFKYKEIYLKNSRTHKLLPSRLLSLRQILLRQRKREREKKRKRENKREKI